MRTTSVALGDYFESLHQSQDRPGRYNNASEVIRAGLRLLEENESRTLDLQNAVAEGFDSGIAEGFDPERHLQHLKARRADD